MNEYMNEHMDYHIGKFEQECIDELLPVLHRLDRTYSTGIILNSLKQCVKDYEENIAEEE